jgi:hypothetical protein
MWQKIIDRYNEGIITQNEMCLKIFETLTEETVQPFLHEAPKEVLEYTLKKLEQSPRTDEEWEDALVLMICTWVGGDGTAHRKAQDKAKADWRRGVELMCRALGGEWNT